MKHNFPEEFEYVTIEKPLNKQQLKEIFHLCVDAEIEIGDFNYNHENYPFTTFEKSEVTRVNIIDSDDLKVSFEEFKAFLQGKGKYVPSFKQELNLNSKYKAVITKNNIKVGCQEFSHEKIKELYQLSQKALKSQK